MKIILHILLLIMSITTFGQTEFAHRIDSLLKTATDSAFAPGITVGVVKGSKLVYQNSTACMNLEYCIPFNDSTVIGLASITKQFTSACIGILENRGKLAMDDDVRKYIPELANYGETIQIKHLLNHTSGIRNHNVLLDLQGFDYNHRGYTNRMIEELMFQQKGVNNSPGAKMLYANTNYVMLALIVERVSGRQLHEFAKQELFDPLEMKTTFYVKRLGEVIKNRAYPYYKEDGKYLQPKSLTHCIGAGGVLSTVQDLAKWSQVFLNPKHNFSFLRDFITNLDTLNNGDLMKHARGMFVSPYKGYTTFNHSGRGLGMRSQFICIPEKDLAVIAYTNSEDINAVNISYEILDLFIDEASAESKIENLHKNLKIEKRIYEGIYQELNSDLRMKIFVENDTLKAISSFGRDATALLAQSTHSFSRIDNPSIVYSFQTKENKDADLLVDFGGAIFYFESIELASKPNQNLSEFTGTYYSDELHVTYSIFIEENELFLSYPNNEGLQINEGAKDTFGANRRTKYTFNRNDEGKVISFVVASEGTVKDILFIKTENESADVLKQHEKE